VLLFVFNLKNGKKKKKKHAQSLLVLVAPSSSSLPALQSQPLATTVFVWRGSEWAPSAAATGASAAEACNSRGDSNADAAASSWASLDPVVQWHLNRVSLIHVVACLTLRCIKFGFHSPF